MPWLHGQEPGAPGDRGCVGTEFRRRSCGLRAADLPLVAGCVPFACADFHQRFLRGKPVMIGCPKLDQAEFYVRKLAEIVRAAQPRSLTVVHMEVPCCSGLTRMARYALGMAESDAPLTDVTVGIGGEVLAPSEVAPLIPTS